ncbi:MAG: hypothetical protein A2W31_12790 [Planctomycetes bacterium RBG_16_64_10]|nr:MAG: hypothetical protein A2W31_12790 [Planctomycetes bacterium RBG_16_64_10]
MADKTVILVTRTGLGTTGPADQAFGSDMLDKFLHAVEAKAPKPYAICFYTEGVKVTCAGSPHLIGLGLLERMGVRLVTCQTCLNYYELADQLAVGQSAGMVEIVALMAEADKVITI